MLKFNTLSNTDLQTIYEFKLHDNQHSEVNGVIPLGGARTDLVMPHDSYFVGLSSLKSEGEPKPEAAGMQVIDVSEVGFKTIFNLYSSKDSNRQLQVSNDERYLKSYEDALEMVLNLDLDKTDFELRSIKIPALHVEAIWLHKVDNDESDLFMPISSMWLFEDVKCYNRKEFFDILKNAARDFDLNDNLIGG